jgi:hypothetical protein
MAKKKKSTNAEILQRVNDVYIFMLKGASRQEIIQYSSDEWDVTERTADEYIRKARKHFDTRLQMQRDTELGQAVTRYDMIFQKALKGQDYKTAIQAQARIDKIRGLEIIRQEVTGKDGGAIILKTGMDISKI